MNKIKTWRFKRKLESMRLEEEFRVAKKELIAARPCYEEHTYSTSIGGPVECGSHGGIFTLCKYRKN